jgi:hypothetical protein
MVFPVSLRQHLGDIYSSLPVKLRQQITSIYKADIDDLISKDAYTALLLP